MTTKTSDNMVNQMGGILDAPKNNPVMTEHRLTWRMWHPVYVFAFTREAAIAEALRTKPLHIPAGTELYYGMVQGSPAGVAK